jgi:uncharacterized sodium:solute symporter family permease YidK
MVVGLAMYSFFTFVVGDGLHFLHGYAISFLVAMAAMLLITLLKPRTPEEISAGDTAEPPPVDMTPWKHAKTVSCAIFVAVVVMYLGLTLLVN